MIQNYSSKEYKAGISNWDMAIGNYGILYFSNLTGLLRYDGYNWDYIKINGGKISRSIHKDYKGRIYIGSNNEIGYLNSDSLGQVYYQSLRKKLQIEQFGNVIQTLSIKDKIYFITLNYLIQYDQSEFKHWKLNKGFGGFIYNERIYIKEVDKELKKLENDSLNAIPMINTINPNLIRNNVTNLTQSDELYIIDINSNKGYKFKNDSIFETKLTFPFGKSVLSITGNENSFWASTVRDGIFNFNLKSSIINHIGMKNGFPTNIIFNIHSDKQNGVWALHQDGITRIQSDKKIMCWNKNKNSSFIISEISNKNSIPYFATLNGLYSLKKNSMLNFIPASKDRLFHIFEYQNFRVAMGEKGMYQIIDSKNIKTHPIQKATNSFDFNESTISITTFNDGIIKYNFKNQDVHEYIPEINGFCNSTLSMDSIHWLSYKSEGIYLINDNNGHPKWKFFNQKHGLPDVSGINILKTLDDEILFSTTKGFYTLNARPKADSSDFFVPHTKITSEKLNINNIDQDKFGNYWITVIEESQKQSVIKYERQKDGSYLKITQALKVIPNQNFSTIYVDESEDSVVWIAGSEGLYRFDEKIKVNYDIKFNTFINNVSLRDSLISAGIYKTYKGLDSIPTLTIQQSEDEIPKFDFSNNNIKFGFSALFYEQPKRNQYSYKLEGFDKKWSSWTSINNKEYTNLPAGSYTFKVKSKNLYDVEGATATYTFSILPPWYQTTWAYLIFSVITVGIIWFLMLAYTYRVRQHRKKLKLIVADRTFEVMQQKRVIEKQLVKMQNLNEEISQQRDDILEKNEELESSQQKIITTNEKLQELNHALEERVEKRTAKIKDTIRKLQQTNKDLDTFTYKTSHDLKGPISRIKGILALARYENPEAKSDKYLDLIEKTTKEMDILLAKLTQVHNIYNSKIEYNSIDIPTVFRDVMDRISPLVEQSQFKFKFDLQNENELKTDVKMLELILLNLLENALTYFDDDKPQKEIKLSTIRKTNTFYLSIEDNGIGIPEKQLPKIFEMFYRGSEKSIGNGLGLYLVKVAVEKIGAKLECESEEHNFTRIIIKFPLNKE
ncbi:sensor histidine kinase [Marivirga arenosa]|uniref:histidine kinase n=1 Tax=Marivirga arenosa TaxID=3059076 RepID=A0AA51ZXC5_9BACT|nr:ATP-binding protein [Marivirga sp. BKB1-2]WNB18484.1 ATP-binding protein [Marivirga sp. BKB1-2]